MSASAKRVRTAETKVTFRVIDPTQTAGVPGFEMIGSSGKGFVPKHRTYCVELDTKDDPPFWKLWKNFTQHMLCNGKETTPCVDLMAPLSSFKDKVFKLCEWQEEHAHLRKELEVLKYTDALSKIEQEEKQLQQQLEQVQARKTKCIELLEEAKK